ncbi:GNAT family N-acetyltransferase/peptidase C39 family protein [Rhodoligotrophos defluvii]|uniref:GNAT family N-acetyltransferase/peptidase C39 family protein n=1 Tax=Rhodoligotrophos defluvii TaxID=2561934 RepID=UPI0010C95243|nr:GNAT family N-acetyltransferase/peptidase C39 family protein [Rhodoligotrophos defluvii]
MSIAMTSIQASSGREPSAISLRLAEPSDIPVLVALENAVFETDRISARSFKDFLRSDSAVVKVAELNGRVAGYGIVLFRRTTSVARVYSIAVAPFARGRKIGEHLMRALEACATERDALFMRLEVRPDNHAAIALYQRLGYRAFGRFLDYYGDHSDALRFEKSLLSHAPTIVRQVPYYPQSTDFTCGPAAMMMALAGAGAPVEFSKRFEIGLWRQSTTIFMTSGPGGCEPLGMAVTLACMGLKTAVYVSNTGPLFLDGVRSQWKRDVMITVQEEFQEQARALGVPVHYRPLSMTELREALKRGACVIVLVSAYRMYHERSPHWILAYDCDDSYVFAHDPWVDPESYEIPASKAAVAIPVKEFERMSVYGKSRLRAAVIVEPVEHR